MGIKKGTKRTDNPKDTVIRSRVDAETIRKLNYITDKLGISRSDVIRIGIEMQFKNEVEK